MVKVGNNLIVVDFECNLADQTNEHADPLVVGIGQFGYFLFQFLLVFRTPLAELSFDHLIGFDYELLGSHLIGQLIEH